MAYTATYINANQFSTPGDVLAELRIGTRIACDQGVDGVYIDDITVALYDAGDDETVITVETGDLTDNLTAVLRGPTFVDDAAHESNLSQHDHSAAWQGGDQAFGALTDADIVARLISWGGISPSVANFILGVNSAGTGVEKKGVTGTANQVTVAHAANLITLSTPQNIHAAATPTFAGLTLSALEGLLVAGNTGLLAALVASAANQIPRWNVANTAWEMVDFKIEHCGDIEITDRQPGQTLVFNELGKLINAASAGGSGGVSLATVMGLITALGGAPDVEGAAAVHAGEHIAGGGDIIDADKLEVDYSPTDYTPAVVGGITDATDQLTSHLQGIASMLAVPDPATYCPKPFKWKSATQLTFPAGDYYFEGYRHRGAYEKRTIKKRTLTATDLTINDAAIAGGVVNSSWYSVFLRPATTVILPIIRVKSVALDGGNTNISIGQQDDHTVAEDGFVDANDIFNSNRLLKISKDTYDGSVYTIADTVNQVGDYLVVTGDKTAEIIEGDWLVMIPIAESVDLINYPYVYLGVFRLDDAGNVANVERTQGTWTYAHKAEPVAIEGNESVTSVVDTVVSPGVPPTAEFADIGLFVDSGLTSVGLVGVDLFNAANDFALRDLLMSTGTSDVKTTEFHVTWTFLKPAAIGNRFFQDSDPADYGLFNVYAFTE